jgi:hypothetical protein
MQKGGGAISAGFEGCIFYPKLNVDAAGLATDSDDFTKVTKVYMIESSFINERDMLTRVNAITGSRGVINILGTDIIKSFPEDYHVEYCPSIKDTLTPVDITTDESGNELLDGANLTVISPIADKYIQFNDIRPVEGSAEEKESMQVYSQLSDILTPLKPASIRKTAQFIKSWINKYKRYKERKVKGEPLVYCLHQKKITSNIEKHIMHEWTYNPDGKPQEKWPMQNFRDAFEALLKISHNNIIHYDMTTVNIFHDETVVLIGDWGLSVDIESEDIFERKFDFFEGFHEIGTKYNYKTRSIYRLDALCIQMISGGRTGQVSREIIFCTLLYFLWEDKDTILKEITTKYSGDENYPKLINLIKFVSSLQTKEELRPFLKIVMKHSDLCLFIKKVIPLIDIPEERAKYLVDQIVNYQNYDSFYEVLSEVEGAPVAPPADIVPILAEKRNQIIKIIGPPSQGGGRKKRSKTGKRRYKKKSTRRVRR